MKKDYGFMTSYLQLNSIDAYTISFSLSNTVWDIVDRWSFFAKDTVGKQFVKAVDSISANIAEGFGRYTKKDRIHFYHYSRGSVQEALDWNEKAFKRKLISAEQYEFIRGELHKLPREINLLINYTRVKLSI